MATRKLVSKHVNAASGDYIGRDGELWVDTVTNLLKISDGATPGGVVLTTDGDITSTWANITDINNAAGPSKIAVGNLAGETTQGGAAIAIGLLAGRTTQGASAVAIGNQTGKTTQGGYAVAVGNLAGEYHQGSEAVAIGSNAGRLTQGEDSIAIGKEAGYTNQAANSIVLNATGAALNNIVEDVFIVKPVRGVAGAGLPAGFKQVAYNPTTGEFIYYDA
jgi:hypothetical protein